MSDNNKNKKRGTVINIQKFDPKQINEFTKEEMPYTQICNKVINECTNPVAGFIWIYLQSKPPTWKPCKWEIMKRFNISESTYKRHMSYLSATNLVYNYMSRNEDGTIDGWRVIVLNGSQFDPKADNYKGVAYTVHVNENPPRNIHSVKNDTVDYPAPDKGFDHGIKNDTVDSNHSVKKPVCGEMNPLINKDINSLEKKNKPPISPKGDSKGNCFSLSQMIEDNPHNIPESMLSDWLEVRKSKRAKMTPTAWNSVNSVLFKLRQEGLNPLECFETVVASGWQGIKVSYFQRDIDALKAKPHYPTPDERAANEQKIRAREITAAEQKRLEIEASRGFKRLVEEVRKKTRQEIQAEQEARRLELGMSAKEYHAYVLNNAKNSNNG